MLSVHRTHVTPRRLVYGTALLLCMAGFTQCGAPNAGVDGGAAADGGRDGLVQEVGPSPDAGDVHADRTVDGGLDAAAESGSSYTCPMGATLIDPSMDPATTTAAINSSPAGATLCISGNHPVTGTLHPKANQTWIGIGANARLGGAVTLVGWKVYSSGIWVFDGPAANIAPTIESELSMGVCACTEVSVYANDVFFADQRMLRVLGISQLGTGPLPEGQKETTVEFGRFFFDYVNHRIYIDQDPTGMTVELATEGVIVRGGAGIDNVTLEGLTIEKATSIAVSAEASANWTVRDVTVRFAHDTGIAVPHGTSSTERSLLERVVATNNGRYGMQGSGNWIELDSCEISWNNLADYRALQPLSCPPDGGMPDGKCGGFWGAGGAKFVLALGTSAAEPGLDVEDMSAHDNVGPGFWLDVHNQFVRISGGEFHDNEGDGVFYEISCGGEITGATFHGNGRAIKSAHASGSAAGIHVSDSNGCLVHGNRVFENPIAIELEHPAHKNMLAKLPANQCPPAATETDISSSLRNNAVYGNATYLCTGERTGSTTTGIQLAPRGNGFSGNTYAVASVKGTYWDDGHAEDFAAWQKDGEDLDGGITDGCASPTD
jgi:hypothetical protein